MVSYQDPFSPRAEAIARRAILRADVHGVKQYGPALAPLAETRDMIEEAIEELLDAIYYQIRQVAKLQDLRETISVDKAYRAVDARGRVGRRKRLAGGREPNPGSAKRRKEAQG